MLANSIYGMENTALIGLCRYHAPIQNIGHTVPEFKDVCDYVDLTSLSNGQTTRPDCRGMSLWLPLTVFSNMIISRGYAIHSGGTTETTESMETSLSYGDLKSLDPATVTSAGI